VDLPSAGLPADRGLASLGLLMQLAGRTSGALAALVASVVLLEHRTSSGTAWFCIAVALCLIRSRLHATAGRDLAYGRRSVDGVTANPFEAAGRYAAFSVLQATAIGLIASFVFGATARTAGGLTAALAVWPIFVSSVAQAPGFARFTTGLPLGEDRGLEGAALVMTVLGACGAVSTGAVLLMLRGLPSRQLEHGWGVMLVVVFVLLLVRSSMHVRAGLAGLREASLGPRGFDGPTDLAGRYASFGIVSAFCVGGALTLLATSRQLVPAAIASVSVVCWLLVAWPLAVKRFFHHRQFAELLAGDRVIHRRAPDAGLTGLGWLLAGHAALTTAVMIAAATVERHGAGHELADLLAILTGGHGASGLAITAVVLEGIAAGSLLRMTPESRTTATVYALLAIGVGLTALGPLLASVVAGRHAFDPSRVLELVWAAVQLVIPAATVALVHRAVIPAARASYRVPPGIVDPRLPVAGPPALIRGRSPEADSESTGIDP
jgi:hypothetical protein